MSGNGRARETCLFERALHARVIARVPAARDVDDSGERIEFVAFVGVFAQVDVEGKAVQGRRCFI